MPGLYFCWLVSKTLRTASQTVKAAGLYPVNTGFNSLAVYIRWYNLIMEKEFIFDQDVVVISVVDDESPEELIQENDLDDEEYTSVDESEIDWSTL